MPEFPQPIEYDALPRAVMDYSTLSVIARVARENLTGARLRRAVGLDDGSIVLAFDVFREDISDRAIFDKWLISAETGGRVAEILVGEGETILAGDTVIKLDDTTASLNLQAALARLDGAESTLAIAEDPVREGQIAQLESALQAAEAQFAAAESGLERARRLFDEGAISESDLEAAETGYEAAKAGRDSAREILDLALEGSREEEIAAARSAVDAARANVGLVRDMLDKTSIRTPIEGVISDIWFEEGELVGPGTPVFRVVNTDSFSMEIGLGDREVPIVSTGQEVDVTVDAYPGFPQRGVVTRVNVVTDPMSGTFPAEIAIVNDEADLRAGMVARAFLVMEEVRGGLVIPLYAVLPGDNVSSVFLEMEGVAKKRDVEIELIVGDLAAISSGIDEGDRVIVRGANYLEDGDDVRVVDEWEIVEGPEM